MGDRRKQMRNQDEIEGIDRRKSSRIIALEEKKKQQERERKLAMAMEKKNKGKGKATVEVRDDLSDLNEDEEGPTKKGHKNKELYQLISSIKELGSNSQNATASGAKDSSQSGMQLKKILEIIIDFLQRKDLDELFAEPVPDVVEHYHKIVKRPMDFATMRAKLYEDMYMDLEYFKRDVLLICSNAMSVNPPSSKHHQVAEDISRNAKWIFEALNAEPQHIDIESSQNKRRPGKKPQNDGQARTSRRASPKPAGRKNATETDRRDMYWPPNKPLVAEVLCGNKPNIQLNENPIKYKESLLRFVEDLGPAAKRVAEKKLQPLQDQQRCNVETPSQNLLENASGTQIIHQQTQQPPSEPDLFNAQTLALALPFLNRQLRNPGFAASVNRIFNTNAGNVNTNASSRNVFSIVHPTRVISGPQPRPASTVNLSDMSQRSRRYSMYDMPGNILTGQQSLVHQHQPWPAESSSSLNPSPLCQPTQRESIPGTSHQAGNFQAMLNSQDFNNNTYPMQASYDRVLHQAAPFNPTATQGFPDMPMQGISQMKPHGDGPVPPLQEPNASSSLQMALGGAINHYGEEGQPEEAPPQLLWEDDQPPNLDLGL